jgi:hypothetical protein
MSASLNPTPTRRTLSVPRSWRLAGMIAATVVCLAAAVVGGIAAILSPTVFDHPGNAFNPLVWLAFLLLIGFWVICILGPFVGWVAWTRRQEPIAWAAMATPAAWCLVLVTVVQFVPG